MVGLGKRCKVIFEINLNKRDIRPKMKLPDSTYGKRARFFENGNEPYGSIKAEKLINPLALEMDTYTVAHHLCKM